jgi:dTDP-4-dehydrorhamnose reductase
MSRRPTILLTGADGQLGAELAPLLRAHGDVVAARRATLDLADPDAIAGAVRGARPQLIVNTAAYTAVDLAEKEPALAHAVNGRAPGILAEEAKRIGAVLIHYSTDYVFDGARATPYPEEAPANPLNVYGASKLEGERAIGATGACALTFRTSWVYGLRGKNFLQTIRRLAGERDELRIVADQIGVPNWSRALAEATARVVSAGVGSLAERSGLYHLSSTGQASWYEFAQAIVGEVARPRVIPISSSEYPTPAPPMASSPPAGLMRCSVSRCPNGATRCGGASRSRQRPGYESRAARQGAGQCNPDVYSATAFIWPSDIFAAMVAMILPLTSLPSLSAPRSPALNAFNWA